MATRQPRTVTAELMDRPQGEPGQEAARHLFTGASGPCLPALRPGLLPPTPLHCDLGHARCHPFQAFLLQVPLVPTASLLGDRIFLPECPLPRPTPPPTMVRSVFPLRMGQVGGSRCRLGPGRGRRSTGLPFSVLLCRGPRCPCPVSSRPLKPMTAAAETHRGFPQQTLRSGLCMGHPLSPRRPRR